MSTARTWKDCYQAWIPEPALDSRPDVGGAVRLSERDDITVQVIPGRTPLGRRLKMVADVDLVTTISGRTHTEVVVEQALESRIPVFPIPNAGGDSKKLLKRYRERIAAGFASGALDRGLRAISRTFKDDPGAAAKAAVDVIRTAKIGRWLVLMPFDKVHNTLSKQSIRTAVEKHMFPLRLDAKPRSEEIYGSFSEAIHSATAVIVDVTNINVNVMYEIGFARALGLTPLLYTRAAKRLKNLPVYLRTLNVRFASTQTGVAELIEDYLRSFSAGSKAELADDGQRVAKPRGLSGGSLAPGAPGCRRVPCQNDSLRAVMRIEYARKTC